MERQKSAVSSAHFASLTRREFASETHLNEVCQSVAELFHLDVIQHFVDKGLLQQQAGFLLGNTTLAHVEQSIFIHLANA
jgi:hypothetical protein